MGSTWIPMTSIEDLTTKFNTRSSTFMGIGQTRKMKTKKEWKDKKERGKIPYYLTNLSSCLHYFNWTFFQLEEKKYKSEEGNIRNGLK
jgi:hypothetical protein